MGEMIQASCRHCGRVFTLLQGTGEKGTVYYCDRCERSTMRATPPGRLDGGPDGSVGRCRCGGRLCLDASAARCPDCHQHDWAETGRRGIWD